ncbi:MAG TPA: glycerophosphodiester phosphodiesterase [Candidatus Brachybacterium merdigallinarum]|nr:glycerophosphodiester phosphodiesterase [Candidatus Brachybacterium merdigallinarum]
MAPTGARAASAPSAGPLPALVGHRGAAEVDPENTLRSFRRGIADGSQLLECDVHLSADGLDVIIHDATLDRTAQAESPVRTGAVVELTRAQLDTVLVGQGEHIPTLTQVLDVAAALPDDPSHCATVLVEIKAPAAAERVAHLLLGRYPATAWERKDLPARVISFHPEALRTLQRLAPAVPRGLLVRELSDQNLRDAVDAQVATLAVRTSHLRDGDVERIRTAGITPMIWGVRTPEDLPLAIELGIPWVGSDDPARTRAHLQELQGR